MTGPEIKPGKWRLKDGREVVVLWDCGPHGIIFWFPERKGIWTVNQCEFEGAEYLGPAVIGEALSAKTYWAARAGTAEVRCLELERQCKELEAETVATRELLEKSEERCEELAKELEESDESFRLRTQRMVEKGWFYEVPETETTPYNSRAQEAETKLASAQCVIEGLEERVRFLEEQVMESPAFDLEDGASVYRFKSVTVMVRDRQEAFCFYAAGRWYSRCENMEGSTLMREDSEQWCREQLEPRWREATEGDVGKACRVRDSEDRDWQTAERLVEIIDHEFRFIAVIDSRRASVFRFCEVQD